MAHEVLGRPNRLSDGSDSTLAELLCINDPGGYGRHVGTAVLADVSDSRLPLMLLAQVAAAYEQTMDVHIWRSAHPHAAGWLEFLASTGYTLSAVEQLAIDTAAGSSASEDDTYGEDEDADGDLDDDGPDAA